MPLPSASASRFAAHWVAEALAGDESLDFSVIKALVGVSTESLTGATEATRERVALRCLQEVVTIAAEGDVTAAAAAGSRLRVDATRSCEELLLELIGEVGSSGSLDKHMLPPFSQDIQNFICIKIPTLPETSFELLREVNPEITSMVPPSPVEQNGNNKHDNDQSLCNISHDHVNTEELGCPTDNAQLHQENLANETGPRNVQKDPMEPTPDFHQPCTSYSRCYDHPREDNIGAFGVSVRSPEKSPTNVDRNMFVAAEPALASCSAALPGSNTEPMSKQDAVDHTTMLQPQSCGDKYPNPPHYNDGERQCDDGTSIQPSKDLIHEGSSMQATVAPDFGRSSDALPTNTSERSHLPEFVTEEDTTMIVEPHSSKTDLSSPQHDGGGKVSQDLDDGSARIQPVEKDPGHDELTLRTGGVGPFVSCNGAIQGDKPESNHPQENTSEHTKMFEQKNGDKAHLEVSCANKVNSALHDDGIILKKNTVCGGQTALESACFHVALHNKNSEADSLSEKNTGKNMVDIQKPICVRSVPNSHFNGNEGAKQASKETAHVHCSGDSSSGFVAACLLSMRGNMPFCSQDKDTNGSTEGLTEQDLCVKCGTDGQLLKCSNCLLAAHDSCFGSLVTFDDSGQFHCPVCFYTKATEAYQNAKKTYCEARKNLTAFLGTKQLVKQHDEQPPGVLPSASHSDDLNGYNSLKRKTGDQRDEEPDRQRKKQKRNASSDACCEEVVTEKAPSVRDATSDVELMNKHSVLQNNSKVQDSEKEQQVENTEAHENSHNETRNSSHNKHGPSATNQEVDADKEGGLTNSNQPEDSEEMEATSSYDSGKRSLPPFHNIRHRKAGVQERETPILSNSRKTLVQQDQHMPSPSRKRNYAYPTNSRSGPVAPTGRRLKLCWTEEEETALKEAMAKFTPRDNGPFPWVQILEHGKDVFHNARLPCDLRVKWRNMMKKAGS